jgi:putative membrane protein
MEKKLLRIIINPAMIAAWVFGLTMIFVNQELLTLGWLHVKLTCLLGLQICHALFARWRKDFEYDRNVRPAKFYRIWNEVPAALMVVIVIMAVVKPF